MKIYSRTGDEGTTGLVGGKRVFKADLRMRAIGDVDELNATIGLARIHASDDPMLIKVQNWLFEAGAELASPDKSSQRAFDGSEVRLLEASIDEIWSSLPPLTNFILPGGAPAAAQLHHARTVCRRAERSVLVLHEVQAISLELRVFLNRLSDWLFAAARRANTDANVPDIVWVKSEKLK